MASDPLTVRCPWCRVNPGEPCITYYAAPLAKPHRWRVKEANRLALEHGGHDAS